MLVMWDALTIIQKDDKKLLIAYTFLENREFVFIIVVQFMMRANSPILMTRRSYSFICTLHHLIIIILQTYL